MIEISISFFVVNFKFFYFSYLKYLLKILQFQFPFNFFIQTSHFTSKNFKFSKQMNCSIKLPYPKHINFFFILNLVPILFKRSQYSYFP